MSGIGKGTQTVDKQTTVTGAVEEGSFISYTAAVLEDDQYGADVPGLLGLEPLAQRQTYVASHTGKLHMVPPDTDHLIKWLAGTKVLACKKGKGKHWMLPIGKWSKVKSRDVQEAFVSDVTSGLPQGSSKPPE